MRAHLQSVLLALSVVLLHDVSAQGFTFIPADTILSAPLGSEIVFDVTLTNTSQVEITLSLIRALNDLPPGWESSMCLNVCYPPTTDSVMTTPAFGSSPLAPGESRPFSVHVYSATNPGAGVVQIVALNTRDTLHPVQCTFHASSTSADVKENNARPSDFVLHQNYPNPFNPTTLISFDLPEETDLSLTIIDVAGKEISTLENGTMTKGHHQIPWDASTYSSGIYLYRLVADGLSRTRKMVVLR